MFGFNTLLCILGDFLMLFLLSAEFFQNLPFQKILSGISSECQTVLIQIRPDVLSGLVLVQTVCKGYQQTILGRKVITFNFLNAG